MAEAPFRQFVAPEAIMSPRETFGARLSGVRYTARPAAYVVVSGDNAKVAAVRGPGGMIGLPGGGSLSGESPEETVMREVREELARGVRLVRRIGAATQFFHAADDACHYEMSAIFFLAEFTGEPAGRGEHDLFWLPVADADASFFHACHAWAVRQGLQP